MFAWRPVVWPRPLKVLARPIIARLFYRLAVLILAAGSTTADNPRMPLASQRRVQAFDRVEQFAPWPPDMEEVRRQDRQRGGGPHRFAVRRPVDITPDNYGTWERLEDGTLLWRLQVTSPEAVSLNLGFSEFFMPPSARCFVYSVDGRSTLGPFTQAHHRPHGRLFTPILATDDVVIELSVNETEAAQVRLRLEAINHGYRDIEPPLKDYADGASGACNVNVACTEGDPWRDQIRAVAMYQISGSLGSITCTGTLVNNTAEDGKPYFLTGYHCFDEVDGLSDCTIAGASAIAASLIVYWKYQAGTCSGTSGSMKLYQAGGAYRAGYCDSDFALLELDAAPVSAADVFFAGWDRGSAAPGSAVAIHHPSGDIKKISVEQHPLTVTSFGEKSSPGDGTHLRVADWDVGTTESGSSGCPLFNPAGRLVGQLHGGDAACTNNLPDWFGRFYKSWSGGGTAATRLRDWLDPRNSGVSALDGKNADLATDAYEPDNSFAAAATLEPGVPQSRSILPVGDVDWARFTVDAVSEAVIETAGPDGDTRMWLYDENLVQIAFDDDSGSHRFSRIERLCGRDALMPGTYYVKVDEYGGNDEIAAYELRLDLTPFSAADLTGDCRVDLGDLSVLAAQWLVCGRMTGDIDDDGCVNAGDLLELAGRWLDAAL
ncbi:MAG: trypsin-like peptidase domain-containing protein [Phycisphaerae bacterium]|nr:trypsin-like peptidase domain-containing protein [Phycisphaerae bacterium]